MRLFQFTPPFGDSLLAPHLQALIGAREPVEHRHLPSGRPYIPGWTGDISLAHTRSSCLVAAAHGPWRVGVDIEEEDQSLARTLEQTLSAMSGGENALTAWTMSEALFKCLDKSFSLAQLKLQGDGAGRFAIASPHLKDLDLEVKGWTWLQADLRLSVVLGAPKAVWSALNLRAAAPAEAREALIAPRPEEIVPVRTIY